MINTPAIAMLLARQDGRQWDNLNSELDGGLDADSREQYMQDAKNALIVFGGFNRELTDDELEYLKGFK